jgi:hypothetical protein
VVEKVEYFV